MTKPNEFDCHWREKFAEQLERIAGPKIRAAVMQNSSEGIGKPIGEADASDWSRGAMERLDALVDEEARIEIMTGCACEYPKTELREIRAAYAASGDLPSAHHLLRERFVAFLREDLKLSDDLVATILERGWGLAGVIDGDRIVATKLPKSGHLREYLANEDGERRRELYCHCPRVREILAKEVSISPTYCYCGGGFYKGIWEEILQRPVKIEQLASVLQGDEVCSFAIHLREED